MVLRSLEELLIDTSSCSSESQLEVYRYQKQI